MVNGDHVTEVSRNDEKGQTGRKENGRKENGGNREWTLINANIRRAGSRRMVDGGLTQRREGAEGWTEREEYVREEDEDMGNTDKH
jgi:hypothetical protein